MNALPQDQSQIKKQIADEKRRRLQAAWARLWLFFKLMYFRRAASARSLAQAVLGWRLGMLVVYLAFTIIALLGFEILFRSPAVTCGLGVLVGLSLVALHYLPGDDKLATLTRLADAERLRLTAVLSQTRLRLGQLKDALANLHPSGASPRQAGSQSATQQASRATPPACPRQGQLISCLRCGQQIAPDAETCPRCGARNTWLHPEIERFVKSAEQFEHMPQFRCRYKGFLLAGSAERNKGRAALASTGMSIMTIGLILLFFMPHIGMTLAGIGMLIYLISSLGGSPTKQEVLTEFELDFGTVPPRWKSDDEEFWKDIRTFFNISS